MLNLLIIGAAGSGKGTQSSFITQKYKMPSISMGSLLRDRTKKDDELGLKIKSILEKGDLVTNDVAFSILGERLLEKDCREYGFILDGFPRNLDQAIGLEKFLEESKLKIDGILILDLDRNQIIKRLEGRYNCKKCDAPYNKYFKNTIKEGVCDNCQGTEFYVRKDDENIELINKRLTIYEQYSETIKKFYENKSLIYNIDTSGNVEEISQSIDKILINLININKNKR